MADAGHQPQITSQEALNNYARELLESKAADIIPSLVVYARILATHEGRDEAFAREMLIEAARGSRGLGMLLTRATNLMNLEAAITTTFRDNPAPQAAPSQLEAAPPAFQGADDARALTAAEEAALEASQAHVAALAAEQEEQVLASALAQSAEEYQDLPGAVENFERKEWEEEVWEENGDGEEEEEHVAASAVGINATALQNFKTRAAKALATFNEKKANGEKPNNLSLAQELYGIAFFYANKNKEIAIQMIVDLVQVNQDLQKYFGVRSLGDLGATVRTYLDIALAAKTKIEIDPSLVERDASGKVTGYTTKEDARTANLTSKTLARTVNTTPPSLGATPPPPTQAAWEAAVLSAEDRRKSTFTTVAKSAAASLGKFFTRKPKASKDQARESKSGPASAPLPSTAAWLEEESTLETRGSVKSVGSSPLARTSSATQDSPPPESAAKSVAAALPFRASASEVITTGDEPLLKPRSSTRSDSKGYEPSIGERRRTAITPPQDEYGTVADALPEGLPVKPADSQYYSTPQARAAGRSPAAAGRSPLAKVTGPEEDKREEEEFYTTVRDVSDRAKSASASPLTRGAVATPPSGAREISPALRAPAPLPRETSPALRAPAPLPTRALAENPYLLPFTNAQMQALQQNEALPPALHPEDPETEEPLPAIPRILGAQDFYETPSALLPAARRSPAPPSEADTLAATAATLDDMMSEMSAFVEALDPQSEGPVVIQDSYDHLPSMTVAGSHSEESTTDVVEAPPPPVRREDKPKAAAAAIDGDDAEEEGPPLYPKQTPPAPILPPRQYRAALPAAPAQHQAMGAAAATTATPRLANVAARVDSGLRRGTVVTAPSSSAAAAAAPVARGSEKPHIAAKPTMTAGTAAARRSTVAAPAPSTASAAVAPVPAPATEKPSLPTTQKPAITKPKPGIQPVATTNLGKGTDPKDKDQGNGRGRGGGGSSIAG